VPDKTDKKVLDKRFLSKRLPDVRVLDMTVLNTKVQDTIILGTRVQDAIVLGMTLVDMKALGKIVDSSLLGRTAIVVTAPGAKAVLGYLLVDCLLIIQFRLHLRLSPVCAKLMS
jgi:hypothetical protein